MTTIYHGLLADGVETDDENTDFHFSRPVCETQLSFRQYSKCQ